MPKKVIKKVARPSCAINGFFPPLPGQKYGAMCGQAGLGGRSCHYEGHCENKRDPQEDKQGDKHGGAA